MTVAILLGLLPVLCFLAALYLLDSFKLVRLRHIFLSIAIGFASAFVSLAINSFLLSTLAIELKIYSRYLAPVIEETLKAGYIVYLIRTNKTGFAVDSALHGFAVGAGFALIENIYYLAALNDTVMMVWIVRGFGTAVMHGGVTALFAIIAKSFFEREKNHPVRPFVLAALAAYALHSFFNHFVLPPLQTTMLVVAALPIVIFLVFQRSELATRDWLGVGLDIDQELLELIESGQFSDSRVGQYLYALKARFRGELVADMLCLLRLQVELAIRAKGLLMMRENGFPIKPDPSIAAKLAEIEYLQKSIGTTGMLAIAPFLHTDSKDVWQLSLLAET